MLKTLGGDNRALARSPRSEGPPKTDSINPLTQSLAGPKSLGGRRSAPGKTASSPERTSTTSSASRPRSRTKSSSTCTTTGASTSRRRPLRVSPLPVPSPTRAAAEARPRLCRAQLPPGHHEAPLDRGAPDGRLHREEQGSLHARGPRGGLHRHRLHGRVAREPERGHARFGVQHLPRRGKPG